MQGTSHTDSSTQNMGETAGLFRRENIRYVLGLPHCVKWLPRNHAQVLSKSLLMGGIGSLGSGGQNITDTRNKAGLLAMYFVSIHKVDSCESGALAPSTSSQVAGDQLLMEEDIDEHLKGCTKQGLLGQIIPIRSSPSH